MPNLNDNNLKEKMNQPPNIIIGDKVLVTFDNYFFAPDGKQYRAAFGAVRAVRTAEDSLGVRPNGKSTNWYLEVGEMLVAGCQIHYLVKTDTCDFGPTESWSTHEGRSVKSEVPTFIYNADKS